MTKQTTDIAMAARGEIFFLSMMILTHEWLRNGLATTDAEAASTMSAVDSCAQRKFRAGQFGKKWPGTQNGDPRVRIQGRSAIRLYEWGPIRQNGIDTSLTCP
jgi:hypothetical protein